MVKEKNIVIHIHNDSDKKKKKRRRRKHKKGYKKGVPLGHQTFGNEATLFASLAAIQQNRKEYNEDAKQHAENYIAAKPRPQNLLLENGDDDQHGNRQANLLGYVPPTTSKKAPPITPLKLKMKPVEYTFEGLSKVKTLKELKILFKTAMPTISDKTLAELTKKNKSAAIKAFLKEYHKTSPTKKDDNDEESFSTPKGKVKFEDNTAITSPQFEDNTATTKPQQPAAKQIGRFTLTQIRALYDEDSEGLFKEYGISLEPMKVLTKAQKIKYLFNVMNGNKLAHEYELIEEPLIKMHQAINKEYSPQKLEEEYNKQYPTVAKRKSKKKTFVEPPTVDINDFLNGSTTEVPTSTYFPYAAND